MEKLQLKHIAAYLPYGLKFTIGYGKVFNLTSNHIFNNHTGLFKGLDNEAKPILRPLSDLTKEIEVNGEKFYPCDYFDNECNKFRNEVEEEFKNMSRNNYFDGYIAHIAVLKLLEWHFDIFGLIEKGLAIDINTLK